jgi:site-specific DNA-methyltransferase (adenine-specific)
MKVPNKQMRSVWSIGTPRSEEKTFGKHPTQKSLKLLERIILAASNKGDVILDPFTGSSTTGIAATKYGRKFIGVDLEKDYLDMSVLRYEELNNE